jgi:uroporphyrinogen decarboxylase
MAMNDRFLRACRREPVDCTPVWFMRQAGRYMPEYRAVRAKYSLLEICNQPDLAAEVTLQPVHSLGVDAAILFADILLPLIPLGVDLAFAAGEGPVIHNPLRSQSDVEALRPVDVEESLGNVLQTVRLVRRELEGRLPLIGFAGAPFTLASYLIEGGASRNFLRTKRFMLAEPAAWQTLMQKLVRLVADYLKAQVRAGAQAVQLFDSWVGCLAPEDYCQYVLPYSRQVLREVALTGVPVIHFGVDTATLLPHMAEAGGTVIGLDWRTPLGEGWRLVGEDRAIQGNLDPAALFASPSELEARVRRILAQVGDRAGHIFNTGHGLLPDTPVANVRAVVEMVHEISGAARRALC